MYAVGLIFYEMLFGDIPFTDLDQKNLYEQKKNWPNKVPIGAKPISNMSRQILEMQLNYDFKKRLPADKLQEFIESQEKAFTPSKSFQ